MLSARGNAAAISGKAFETFYSVLENLWHPIDNPEGYVSLGIAENLLMHQEMIEFANKSFKLPQHALTYGDGSIGSKRLRKAFSHFLNRRFDPFLPVTPEQVCVISGITTANEALAWLLADSTDAFLLGRPYYGTFPMDFSARAGVKTIGVSFDEVDPFSESAVAKYEKALRDSENAGVKVRALVICSPHNPLGRCFPKETLIALLRFCEKHSIHFISDEVYALSVWPNDEAPTAPGFTSVLSLDLSGIIRPELVHVMWGMSKDFGANGLRIGCIISQNQDFRASLNGIALFSLPSSAADHITANILEDDEFTDQYIETNRQRLVTNYKFICNFLKEHGIPYSPGGNAGFFVWVDLRPESRKNRFMINASKASNGQDIHAKLLAKKVFLAEGEGFGGQHGWFRIVFSQPQSYLMEGLRRMMEVLEHN